MILYRRYPVGTIQNGEKLITYSFLLFIILILIIQMFHTSFYSDTFHINVGLYIPVTMNNRDATQRYDTVLNRDMSAHVTEVS